MGKGVAGLSTVERGGKKLRGGRLIRKHWSKAVENLLRNKETGVWSIAGKWNGNFRFAASCPVISRPNYSAL